MRLQKKWLIAIFLELLWMASIGQKQRLDTALLNGNLHWPSAEGVEITPDGAFLKYIIDGEPKDSRTLVVRSTEGNWEYRMPRINGGYFSYDSKKMYYQGGGDSLWELRLGGGDKRFLGRVRRYQLHGEGIDQRLYCQTMDGAVLVKELVENGIERRFDSVSDYAMSEDGRYLVLSYRRKREKSQEEELQWMEWRGGALVSIWHGLSHGRIVFDGEGKQIAFNTPDDSAGRRCIWHYKAGMETARKVIYDKSPGVENDLKIGRADPQFSLDGGRLFFSLEEDALPKAPANAVKVNIWNWRDTVLQSEQRTQLIAASYAAVADVRSERVQQLQKRNESVMWGHVGKDDHAVIFAFKGDNDSRQTSVPSTLYWISTENGGRQLICHIRKANNSFGKDNFTFSPEGSRLVWFDNTGYKKAWYVYDDTMSERHKIADDIPWALYNKSEADQHPAFYPVTSFPPAGWLDNGQDVLLYDEYDIWQVNLSGKKPSVCITGGYGRRWKIKLRILAERFSEENSGRIFHMGDTLLLSAFAEHTKENGVYRLLPGKNAPERLCMGPYLLCAARSQLQSDVNAVKMGFLKAQNANVWAARRYSEDSAPNYYVTRDFKHFSTMSDVQPQRQYYWARAELVQWKLPDGEQASGILHKPEDFDPRRKYPIIFRYYEQLSDNLHNFSQPNLCYADINVPYFVSRGYLVFEPDIQYRTGYPGKSALDAIVSAAEWLRKLSFVDQHHMGLSGHSFGGFETNYLVTHSSLFAAAAESAGASDLLSAYSALVSGYTGDIGSSKHMYYEMQQGRMGGSLWENPDRYSANSPVLRADKVTTPLLMLHNLMDDRVAFGQAVELFTALRRLRKPVWLLQYDEGRHGLINEEDARDYTIRLGQFFDHYLKGAPAPVWMTKGVPARLKGIETGLELDPAGK